MGLFINTATAATTSTAAASPMGNPMYSTILMVVAFIAIFYFLIWRPQSKKMKQQRNLLSSLQVGDEVMMNGMLGKIAKLNDNLVSLEIADNVQIMVQKGAISTVLPKGTMKY